MKNKFFPLTSSTWDKKEINQIYKVVKSGKFTMGAYVEKFEKEFAKYHNCKYGVMVNSGSSANLLMVASLFYTTNNKLKLKFNDEVLAPAVGWSTSYSPLYQYNLRIKFLDICAKDFNMDVNLIEKNITKKTKCILIINLLGNPNKIRQIKKIAKKYNLIILEDNCESLGAKIDKYKTGTFGIMSTSSFFYSHHISTIEGGAILTNNPELYRILKILRAHGWTRDIIKNKKNYSFEEKFNFILPGYNLRPTEINAAIGLQQLKKLKKFISNRVQNGNYIKRKFEILKNIYLQKENGSSSWFGFGMILRPTAKITRNKLVNLFEMNGIETRPIVTGNFLKQKVAKNYFLHNKKIKLKNADYIDKNGFFIGNHHFDLRKKIDKIINILEKVVG